MKFLEALKVNSFVLYYFCIVIYGVVFSIGLIYLELFMLILQTSSFIKITYPIINDPSTKIILTSSPHRLFPLYSRFVLFSTLICIHDQ